MLVRNTALWIVTVVAIVGGHMVSAAAEPPIIARVVACCSVIAVLAGMSIGWGRAARWHRIAFAVVVLALARGLAASDRAAAFAWPAARADLSAGVRTFVVEGASSPGASCHVLAHEGARGPTFALELPIELCPLGHGAKVHVPTEEIVVREGASWPGGADPHAVARARGASGSLSTRVAWRGDAGERGYGSWIAELRQRLWTIGRVDEPRAFVVGSLFGARAALAPVPRHELAIAGLGHLVAVSGMQVSLIAWLLHRAWLRVLSPVVGSIGLAFALAAIPMLAYVGLVGAEAPAVRAAIMVLAAGLAAAVGRPAHGLTVLAWTSVVMLAWRPAWAFDVGFQLSIAAMAAIVRAPSDAGLVLQSWRVGWAIVPVLALCFDETGAWAVPANLVAVPVFALWITPMGIAGAIASPFVGAIAWWPAERGAQLVLDLAHGFAMLPRVSYDAVAIVAVLALALRMWPRTARRAWVQRWAPSTLVCIAVLAAWIVRASSPPTPAADAQWIVLGPKRAPTVIARQADGAVCIRDPGGAPSSWPGLMRALAIESVGAITPDPSTAPHTAALRDELDAIGRWHPREGCVWPDDAEVRRAHASCRRHTGGRGDLAAVGRYVLSCFADGRWQALH